MAEKDLKETSSMTPLVVIHHGIQCNECFTDPIIGIRYKSIPKDNYNLCGNCEKKIFKEDAPEQSPYYPMIKITHPSQHPKQLSYTINEYITYNHHNEEFKTLRHHQTSTVDTKEQSVSNPIDFEIEKGEELPKGVIDGKPVAGFTFRQEITSNDPKVKPSAHTWSVLDHKQFQVRIGPDYSRYKKKAPSADPLYEVVAVDVFRSKSRIDHIAPRFHLPDVSNITTHHPSVPPLFIIQLQIPSEPPPSFFSTTEDGPGWSVVMFYRITENTCQQLKDVTTASPAVKLFAEWCEKAPSDASWRGRFKVICASSNLSDIGVPSMIESYNGKPILIRKTGTIFRGSNYLEKDIHVHKFANIAKQSIFLLTSRCSKLFMQIGFVIEGRENHELPETIFACVGINLPQDELTVEIFD